jgi:hypothetical protein
LGRLVIRLLDFLIIHIFDSSANDRHATIFGGLRFIGLGSPDGMPTIMGATTVIVNGIPRRSFHRLVFNVSIAKPITQLPKPFAQAAIIKFSAASQQSA